MTMAWQPCMVCVREGTNILRTSYASFRVASFRLAFLGRQSWSKGGFLDSGKRQAPVR